MFNPTRLKQISFASRSPDVIRWLAKYEYNDYLIEIKTSFEESCWMCSTTCRSTVGVNIIFGRDASGEMSYFLVPDELSKSIRGSEVDLYIKELQDARDIAEYICKNIEKLQRGEIV